MKGVIIFLLLCAYQLNANELSIEYINVNQVISDDISFNQPVIAVGYSTLVYSGFGVKLTHSIDSDYKDSGIYKNKITSLSLYEAFYRVEYERLTFDFEVGYVDYRTHWLVNNKEVAWSSNTDCDFTYGLTIGYNVSKDFKLTIGYDDLYRNESKKKEKTKTISLGLVYLF